MTLLTATANTAGHTKKSTVNAMVLIGWCSASIMAPLTFKSQQAPGYRDGFLSMTVCTLYAAIAPQVMRFILSRKNKKRDEIYGEPSYEDAFTDQTDQKNHNFRYVL